MIPRVKRPYLPDERDRSQFLKYLKLLDSCYYDVHIWHQLDSKGERERERERETGVSSNCELKDAQDDCRIFFFLFFAFSMSLLICISSSSLL